MAVGSDPRSRAEPNRTEPTRLAAVQPSGTARSGQIATSSRTRPVFSCPGWLPLTDGRRGTTGQPSGARRTALPIR
jgi:hypothetical protein